MAKGNLFLGFARGKLGDVVFYRNSGEQCARPRNRSPKNPQTALQLLQRVVMKTVSGAYSLLAPIADHAFQGKREGTPNQSRFAQVNINLLRDRLADEINDGSEELIVNSIKANFSPKGSMLPEINAYQVSEGSLPATSVIFDNSLFELVLPNASGAHSALKYSDVINALGLLEGDQLTFLLLSTDDSGDETPYTGRFNGFQYARVILQPAEGDLSTAFLSGTSINSPNVRNEGTIAISEAIHNTTDLVLQFSVPSIATATGAANSVVAAAVIVSRQTGGVWQRSTQMLTLRPYDLQVPGHITYDYDYNFLGDAVVSFMSSDRSSLYLNQANSF